MSPAQAADRRTLPSNASGFVQRSVHNSLEQSVHDLFVAMRF